MITKNRYSILGINSEMNILIFNWRDPKHRWAGGGEMYVFEQAKRWAKTGHKVTVFCGEDIDNKLPEFEISNGITIHRKGGRYSLYLWAIWYYFKKLRKNADIVIDVENGIPFFTPLFTRLPKLCIVYHVHGKQFFYELPPVISHVGYIIEKYIFPLLYRKVNIIAISKTTEKELIKLGFNRKNIRIIYSGITDSKKDKSKYSKKFASPTILYLGRIKKYKRVGLLVKIFPDIVKKIPNANLIIAGWGTEAANLTDNIMRNSLRKKIKLLGPVGEREKKYLLSKSWIFVNPSIGEGWSIAVIEANLHGTPAISFKVPGLSESIKHLKTGLLAKNESDLIEKICSILKDKKIRNRLSYNAREFAVGFDWNTSANKTLLLIDKLAKK